VAGSCDHGNETSDFIKDEEFRFSIRTLIQGVT
jgi:hypothetical protein